MFFYKFSSFNSVLDKFELKIFKFLFKRKFFNRNKGLPKQNTVSMFQRTYKQSILKKIL